RVKEQPGLPAGVAEAAADAAAEPGVYAALVKAGDPAGDAGEPAWAGLGAPPRDARLTPGGDPPRVPPGQRGGPPAALAPRVAARAPAPARAGAPGLRVVGRLPAAGVRARAGPRRKLLAVPADDLDLTAIDYYDCLEKVDPQAALLWYRRVFYRGSLTRDRV